MVTPETTEAGDRKRPSPWAIVIGLLVLIAGLAAILALTQPDPLPTADASTTTTAPPVEPPSTTTTTTPFRVADVVSGPQIEWVGRESFVGRHVIDVIPRESSFYIFTTAVSSDGRYEGLLTWVSFDGSRWQHLGEIENRFSPTRVIEAGPGFLAFGTDLDEQPMVWLSVDGRDWEPAELPDPQPGTTTWFSGAHGVTDGLIVLISDEYGNPSDDAVSRAVTERYPGFSGYIHQVRSSEEPMIVISGPLGIVMAVLDPEDLGLNSENLNSSPTSRLVAHIGSPDGRSWRREVIADTANPDGGVGYLGAIHKGPDGRLWAQGWTYNGTGWDMYTSTDGVTWEQGDLIVPDWVVPWSDQYVGMTATAGLPRLQVTADLQSWEELFRPSFLPCCLGWGEYFPSEMTAGRGGVAVRARAAHVTHETIVPPALARDGYRLVASPHRGPVLYRGDRQVLYGHHWQPSTERQAARISDDGGAVAFLDPSSGEELVAYTIAELESLESLLNTSTRTIVNDDHHVLYFSPDGETWTIQDLGEMVAGDAWTRLVIGEEQILVLAQSSGVTVVWAGDLPAPRDR